jgi:hypothetical protein
MKQHVLDEQKAWLEHFSDRLQTYQKASTEVQADAIWLEVEDALFTIIDKYKL